MKILTFIISIICVSSKEICNILSFTGGGSLGAYEIGLLKKIGLR